MIFIFQTDGKTSQEENCDKLREMFKVVETIINIVPFKHKCVILKGAFKI